MTYRSPPRGLNDRRASAPAAATISRKSLADYVRKAPVDAFLCGRFANGDRVVEEGIGKSSMRAEALSVMLFAGPRTNVC